MGNVEGKDEIINMFYINAVVYPFLVNNGELTAGWVSAQELATHGCTQDDA